MHRGVWLVVCMAALSAMDYGRRRLTALHLAAQPQQDRQGFRQLSLFEAWGVQAPAPAVSAVEQASRSAVARLWALLADFSSVGMLPRGWQTLPTADHPFLVRVPGPVGGEDRVALVPPPVDLAA